MRRSGCVDVAARGRRVDRLSTRLSDCPREVSPDELRQTASRIVTAKKRFNILAGWTPSEDTLPDRLLQEAVPEDARAQLSPERLSALIKAYNQARGWTDDGWLPAE